MGVVFASGHFAKVEQIWRQGQKMAYFGAELESATTYEKQFRSWPNVQYYWVNQTWICSMEKTASKELLILDDWQDIQRKREWLLTCCKGYSKAKSKLSDVGPELQDNQTICQRDITHDTDAKTRFVPLENCTSYNCVKEAPERKRQK